MSEIPSKWLEESAANAAKKMKPDPYGSGVTAGTVASMGLQWKIYDANQIPDETPFFCLCQLVPNGNWFLNIYVHSKGKRRWWFNLLTGTAKVPEEAHWYALVPEGFLNNFPKPPMREWK